MARLLRCTECGERSGLIPPDRNPAAGSANSRPVWPANHRSAAVVSVWPANNRSPVGSGASGSIHPLGANNGMGRLGQSERANKCQHDGECSTFHFKPLDLRPAFRSIQAKSLSKRDASAAQLKPMSNPIPPLALVTGLNEAAVIWW